TITIMQPRIAPVSPYRDSPNQLHRAMTLAAKMVKPTQARQPSQYSAISGPLRELCRRPIKICAATMETTVPTIVPVSAPPVGPNQLQWKPKNNAIKVTGAANAQVSQ